MIKVMIIPFLLRWFSWVSEDPSRHSLLLFYVDDTNVVVDELEPGARYREGRVEVVDVGAEMEVIFF